MMPIRCVRLRFLLVVSLAHVVAAAPSAQAATDIKPWVNPELRAHTALFEKRVYRIAGNVYSAVGWGLANSIMIEGDDGIVIVDVGEDIDSAREVYEEFRRITDKPVEAVIYTHFHPDHINGVKAYVSEEQVRRAPGPSADVCAIFSDFVGTPDA
jgi:alkyl sulfatase BDS1-like metallo-beta-lactamase superfamily hydrolase